MAWIFFTITAAILQSFRNLEQKNLNKKLDSFTVSWARFMLPFPISLLVIFYTFSAANSAFIFYCLITALFQIAGNVFLLKTIKSRNFSIGIAFYKTEVLQAMILGLLFFHQQISFIGFISIILTTIGMILMSNFDFKNGRENFVKSLNKTALFGALSGLFFAVSAFSIKFSAEEFLLSGAGETKSAIVVLMWVIAFQNLFFIAIKSYQKRLISDLKKLFVLENKAAFLKTGLLSFSGSICWFIAFTIGNVIYVKAVGQVELIMAFVISQMHLQEKHNRSEISGIILTALGILLLLFFH